MRWNLYFSCVALSPGVITAVGGCIKNSGDGQRVPPAKPTGGMLRSPGSVQPSCCTIMCSGELVLHELRVEAALRQQAVVCASLDDLPFVQHHNKVGIANGR